MMSVDIIVLLEFYFIVPWDGEKAIGKGKILNGS